MKSIILLFEVLISQNNPNLFQRLNLGVSQDTFVNRINTIGFDFNDDLFSLYQWKNGIKEPTNSHKMFHCGVFMPLDTAIEVYKKCSIRDKLWSKKYFPVFASYEGEFLLMDMDSKSENFKNFFIYSPLMYSKPVVVYDNLNSLFTTTVKGFEKGAYTYHNDKLQIDFDILYEVCKENNPISVYWNE